MNEEDWNRFLAWLDPNYDKAGLRYEEIRRNLIRILVRRRCLDPEELADKAFDRVINHLPNMLDGYTGEPAKYIVRVAVNLSHEHKKKSSALTPLPPKDTNNSPRCSPKDEEEKRFRERRHRCLEECLQKLHSKQQTMILDYYSKDKKQKIENRKRIADSLGISLNALALRVLRIRDTLEDCLHKCLKD